LIIVKEWLEYLPEHTMMSQRGAGLSLTACMRMILIILGCVLYFSIMLKLYLTMPLIISIIFFKNELLYKMVTKTKIVLRGTWGQYLNWLYNLLFCHFNFVAFGLTTLKVAHHWKTFTGLKTAELMSRYQTIVTFSCSLTLVVTLIGVKGCGKKPIGQRSIVYRVRQLGFESKKLKGKWFLNNKL